MFVDVLRCYPKSEPKIFRMISVIGKDDMRLQESDVLSKEKIIILLCAGLLLGRELAHKEGTSMKW